MIIIKIIIKNVARFFGYIWTLGCQGVEKFFNIWNFTSKNVLFTQIIISINKKCKFGVKMPK